ncbi:MAG: hypothetical protein GYB33_12430 [Gammaproteobacteria bacterium]|nr:hypothetical protein [Gammaproteobacteria bacterium]
MPRSGFVQQLVLGVGFHTPVSNIVDFVAILAYAEAEVKTRGLKEDGNGYLVSAGVRSKPTDKLEFAAFINYSDIENESETGYALGARYFVLPPASLGLGYESADDVDVFVFDIRFDF